MNADLSGLAEALMQEVEDMGKSLRREMSKTAVCADQSVKRVDVTDTIAGENASCGGAEVDASCGGADMEIVDLKSKISSLELEIKSLPKTVASQQDACELDLCRILAQATITRAVATHGASLAMASSEATKASMAALENGYEGLRKMMAEVVDVVERKYSQAPAQPASPAKEVVDILEPKNAETPTRNAVSPLKGWRRRSLSQDPSQALESETADLGAAWLMSRVSVARALAIHSAVAGAPPASQPQRPLSKLTASAVSRVAAASDFEGVSDADALSVAPSLYAASDVASW